MKDCKRIRLPMPQLPEGCKDSIDYLQKLATEGVRCYLAHSEPYCEETLRRVKSELEVIVKGYPEYFIIINELVHWARRNGIPVNVDRGSVCASCLAYLLNLTTENPLLKHLRFEKFINPMFRQRKWKDERVAREYAESLWNNWSRSATHLFMKTHALCGDKTVRYATNRIAIGDVTMQDVGIALKRGDRVAIIVRHAERPPLEKNDPTFGNELRITEHGREQAQAFGFVLSQFTENASRYITTGENLRCDETARLIAKELGAPVSARYVYGENMLGNGSPFFENVHERMALAEQGDYRESLNKYFRTGVQRGFKDLCAATDILEDIVRLPHLLIGGAIGHGGQQIHAGSLDSMPDEMLSAFPARIAFLCATREESIRLIGIPNAVNLYPFCEFFINNVGKIQKFQLRLSLNKNEFET